VYVSHRAAEGILFSVAGIVAQIAVIAEAAIVVVHGSTPERRIHFAEIDSFKTLHASLCVDGARVIAGHAESLSPLEWPDRHAVRALLRHTNQAIDEVGNAVGEEQGVHGMRGAIGVPQGER